MPPGPAFNWLCVLHSAAEILGHAARYRVAQSPRKRRRADEPIQPVSPPFPSTDEVIACSSSPQKLNVDVDDVLYRKYTLPQQLPVSKWDSELLQPVKGPVANNVIEDEKQLLGPDCIEEERPTQVSNRQLILWGLISYVNYLHNRLLPRLRNLSENQRPLATSSHQKYLLLGLAGYFITEVSLSLRGFHR